MDEPKTNPADREMRERAIAALCDHFAHDALEVDEFEHRLDLAHRAESTAELEQLLADLPAPSTRALVPAAPTSLAPRSTPSTALARTAPAQKTMLAILGGIQRQGTWTPPRRLKVVAVLGGAQLDFREVALPPGVTEVHLTTVLGGAEVIVPPGLAFEMEGTAIVGGFDQVDRAPTIPDPDAPVLRITGFAFMGGVQVSTRLPGEKSPGNNRREHHHQRNVQREERRRARRERRGAR